MRSRFAAGLVLLVLTAHAFVASATHFHRPTRLTPFYTQTALQGLDEPGQGVPLAGGEAQCLLCRLQRNFDLGVRHVVAAVAPLPVAPLDYEPLQNLSARTACSLLHPGRAPPPA